MQAGAYRGRADVRRGRNILDLDVPGGSAPKWILLGAGVLLALMLVAVVADLAVWAGRIHPGVRVSGVDVGGLSPADASAKLGKELAPRYKEPVTVRFQDQSWPVDPAAVGAEPATAASVGTALAWGRGGSWVGDAVARLGAYLVPADVAASSTVDPAKFAAQMDAIAAGVRQPTYDALVAPASSDFAVTPPKAGRELDRAAADAAVLAAFSQAKPRIVTVTASTHEAGVTQAAASAAADAARKLAAGSATVTYGGKSWEITPEQLARTITFRVVPAWPRQRSERARPGERFRPARDEFRRGHRPRHARRHRGPHRARDDPGAEGRRARQARRGTRSSCGPRGM